MIFILVPLVFSPSQLRALICACTQQKNAYGHEIKLLIGYIAMASPWAGLVVSLTFCYRICRSIGRSSSTISVSTQQRRSQKIVEGGSVRQAAEGGNRVSDQSSDGSKIGHFYIASSLSMADL